MSGLVPTNYITPEGLVSVRSRPPPRPHVSKVSIPPIVLCSLTCPRCCSLPVPETFEGHATQRGAGGSGPLGLPHDRRERLQPGPDHLQGEWAAEGWASFLLFCSLNTLNSVGGPGVGVSFTGFILERVWAPRLEFAPVPQQMQEA